MARPLRIWLTEGWYNMTARGNRREVIYRTDADRAKVRSMEGMKKRLHSLKN